MIHPPGIHRALTATTTFGICVMLSTPCTRHDEAGHASDQGLALRLPAVSWGPCTRITDPPRTEWHGPAASRTP